MTGDTEHDRAPYAKPHLEVFGRMTDRTRSGSGVELEPNPDKGGQPTDKRA